MMLRTRESIDLQNPSAGLFRKHTYYDFPNENIQKFFKTVTIHDFRDYLFSQPMHLNARETLNKQELESLIK